MVNPDVEGDKEQIALLVQRALVLLGSASHSISLERRKIAWARINPELKSVVLDYRKDKLFGPGFLEKASKKLEADKALAKVTAPPPRKRSHPEECGDLHCFYRVALRRCIVSLLRPRPSTILMASDI